MIDANFIFGCLNHDTAYTNPNDFLEWANNSAYVDVDPHNHFDTINNPYNYSDLSYLLDSCGVTLSRNVLGGVTYADTVVGAQTLQEDWTQYIGTKYGFTYTFYPWQAEIVWGTATPGHIADYTKFGIWKPAGATSPTEFGTHDPNGLITHVGSGCKEETSFLLDNQGHLTHTTQQIINEVLYVADYIQTLPSTPNDYYTMNMLINFRDMPIVPGFVDSLSAIIDGIQPYVNQGKVVWYTLAEKYDHWYATHTDSTDHFKFDCADIPLPINGIEDEDLSAIKIYPNPTTGTVQIKSTQDWLNYRLLTLTGDEVANGEISQFLDFSDQPTGVYILEIQNGDQVIREKVIKN